MSKRAIVTGASSGIGRAIACELVKDGWQVLAVGRRKERLAELEKEFSGKVFSCPSDITSTGAAEIIIKSAQEKLGGIDLLVNNAGTSFVADVASTPVEKIDEMLNLNVRALVLLCRAVIPVLEKSGGGQIINVSSVADRIPMETVGVYCATKSAVTMFSRVLAKEVAAKKIRVNLLCPCGTDTEIFEKAGTKIDPIHLVPAVDIAKMAVLLTKLPESIDLGEIVTQKRFSPF
jgi:NADP-dependent 3-hydroxy acid dehydrogenase YdfG